MSDSIWKKELHLRKPKEKKVDAEVPKAEKAEATSIWKKERHLRRQPEPLPPLPAHLLDRTRVRPERPRGTVLVPVVPTETDPVQRVERWTARVPAPAATTQFPRPAAGEVQDPVALLPRERAAVDPAAVVPALPSPPAPFGWQKDSAPPEPEAAPVTAAPVVEAKPEPVVAPIPEPVAEAEPEPVEEPEPVAEKVPLLKREISLKRKPKAKKPKAEKKPKAVKKPKAEPSVEKVPLLKREISLKRKPKAEQPKAEQPQPAPKAQPSVEKVPLLKREISFKRKPKAAKQPSAGSAHAVRNIVGLRIGSSQLAAAHVRNNGSAEVLQLARVDLDRGVVVAGEVRDQAALAKALKSFFSANKLPKKDIRLGVASNRIGVRLLSIPAVDDPKQFENAIRFRAQETLPIPITDAVLDHVILGDDPSAEGENVRRVLVVFAHRELVSRYVDVCKQAGLRLAGIDLDAFGLLRAVSPVANDASRRATIAVGIGHERTVFAVSDGEVCDYTRVLEWGGSSIDIAIARALNLTPSQAEPLKRELDLDAVEPPASMSPMQFEAARAATKAEIAQLVRELMSSLRFYQSREDSLDIGEILISGGGAQLPGLAAEVQRGLGAPVRVADPFGRVSFGKKVAPPAESGSLAIAVGLGIDV
jgi:type IV pilus assembly protein PilM